MSNSKFDYKKETPKSSKRFRSTDSTPLPSAKIVHSFTPLPLDNMTSKTNQAIEGLRSDIALLVSSVGALSVKVDSLLPVTNQVSEISTQVMLLNKNIDEKDEKIASLESENSKLKEKLLDIESRSRRCNLKFFNIKEDRHENEQSLEDKLLDAFKQADIGGMNRRSFERSHRVGKFSKDARFPRPVIVCFNHYKDRQRVWEKFNKKVSKDLFVREDKPNEVLNAQRQLLPILHAARNTTGYQNASLRGTNLFINGKVYNQANMSNLPEVLRPEAVHTPMKDDQVSFFTKNLPVWNNISKLKKQLSLRMQRLALRLWQKQNRRYKSNFQ